MRGKCKRAAHARQTKASQAADAAQRREQAQLRQRLAEAVTAYEQAHRRLLTLRPEFDTLEERASGRVASVLAEIEWLGSDTDTDETIYRILLDAARRAVFSNILGKTPWGLTLNDGVKRSGPIGRRSALAAIKAVTMRGNVSKTSQELLRADSGKVTT